MYKKIAVAYNESPEAQRALSSAILLAESLNAELETITVMSDLPSYTAFASAADPSLAEIMGTDRLSFYQSLQDVAKASARLHGIELQSNTIEGSAVSSIVNLVRSHNADLLVIGLPQHDFYISRLWSTVYELAQEAPCHVLGVH